MIFFFPSHPLIAFRALQHHTSIPTSSLSQSYDLFYIIYLFVLPYALTNIVKKVTYHIFSSLILDISHCLFLLVNTSRYSPLQEDLSLRKEHQLKEEVRFAGKVRERTSIFFLVTHLITLITQPTFKEILVSFCPSLACHVTRATLNLGNKNLAAIRVISTQLQSIVHVECDEKRFPFRTSAQIFQLRALGNDTAATRRQ